MALSQYTSDYEYACSLIRQFLTREEIIQGGILNMCVDGSVVYTLFTTDFTYLGEEKVQEIFGKILDGTKANEFNGGGGIAQRMHDLYIDIVAALGNEFMTKLIGNVVDGIVSQLKPKNGKARSPKTDRAPIAQFLNIYPSIALCVIGSKIFISEFLLKAKAMQPAKPANAKARQQ